MLSKERSKELLKELEGASQDTQEQSMERLLEQYVQQAERTKAKEDFHTNVAQLTQPSQATTISEESMVSAASRAVIQVLIEAGIVSAQKPTAKSNSAEKKD